MEQKKKLTILTMLLMYALIPLVTVVVFLFFITSGIMVSNLEENTREELMVATKGLREYYEYDLLNEVDLEDGFLEYDTDYIDSIKATGVDLTIFKDNIRFMTTIIGSDGKRIEGTPASDAVWAAVSSGQDYYSDDVVINGTDYYVYYMPLYGSDGVRGMAFSGKTADQINAAEKHIYLVVALVGIAGIVVFTLIAWFFAIKVSSPLKAVAASLQKLSDGETDVRIDEKTSIQETAQIIAATTKLGDVLKSATGKIRSSAETLTGTIGSTADMAADSSEATGQIADSMQALTQTTMTMAQSVQDINDNMNHMGDIISQAVDSVNNLNSNAGAMSEANREAADSIRKVISSSERSADAVEDIANRINATNEAVTKINEMVALITGIASQTNLLSLNASIEAARAGEAGRGFAVVAEEIKTLAEQSDVSANQIKDIVAAIGESSTKCVEHAKKVRELITDEKELLLLTQDKFANLDRDIQNSVEEISSVSMVTGQLESIKDTIANAVTDLSAISEETSATNEEVAASIQSVANNVGQVSENANVMNDLSADLKEAVAYFK
ncbi:MAG: methyl-accepting chemotaxis protein [Lachnospiraceae bacterium]|nr:methyl-accepting chemotaxis protein [Lachnospiraceae bacterium]